MSSDATPISPARFAAALPSLPTATLHAKAAELLNSLSHLHESNSQLLPFADPSLETYDAVCAESIEENLVVMGRMRTRLEILKEEVESRGGRWVWGRLAEEEAGRAGDVNGLGDGDGGEAAAGLVNGGHAETELRDGDQHGAENDGGGNAEVNGVEEATTRTLNVNPQQQQTQQQSGRLTDDELARRMAERMAEELGDADPEDDADEQGGLYL